MNAETSILNPGPQRNAGKFNMFALGDRVIETRAFRLGSGSDSPHPRDMIRRHVEITSQDGNIVTTSQGNDYDARDGMAIPRINGEYRTIMHLEFLDNPLANSRPLGSPLVV